MNPSSAVKFPYLRSGDLQKACQHSSPAPKNTLYNIIIGAVIGGALAEIARVAVSVNSWLTINFESWSDENSFIPIHIQLGMFAGVYFMWYNDRRNRNAFKKQNEINAELDKLDPKIYNKIFSQSPSRIISLEVYNQINHLIKINQEEFLFPLDENTATTAEKEDILRMVVFENPNLELDLLVLAANYNLPRTEIVSYLQDNITDENGEAIKNFIAANHQD